MIVSEMILILPLLAGVATGRDDGPAGMIEVTGHANLTFCLAFSPDGRSLLTAGPTQGQTRAARLWDVASGRELATFGGQESGIYCLDFAPDGRSFVMAGANKAARIFDLEGNVLATLPHPEPISRTIFSPDGRSIASGCTRADATVRIWDVASATVSRTLVGHGDRVGDLDFSPDGRSLASASRDGTIRIWDLESGRVRAEAGEYGGLGSKVLFSPDGRTLATSSFQAGEIRLLDAATGAARLTIPHKSVGLVFAPDGHSLYAGGLDQLVHVFEMPSGKEQVEYPSRLDGRISQVAASADGRAIAWCGEGTRGGNVRILHLPGSAAPARR